MDEITRLAPGVVLLDIASEMPRHRTKRYGTRRQPITGWYFHHSGKLGKPGKQGAINSARYVTQQRKVKFPGPAYHIWLPFKRCELFEVHPFGGGIWPSEFRTTALVCFRLNADKVRCWHTGGKANTHGRGVVFQGNTSTDGLSESQVEIAEALIPWMGELDGLDPADAIRMHCEADEWGGRRKPSCPGTAAAEWLREYRDAA